ncbi:MAG: TlyA family RNA methyltransferase, partial [Chloroflexota bacterium]
DVGASTGGFTDCLLQRGARKVYALDVGRGQIDYRLRTDPRVVVIEGVNARYPFALPEQADMATVDVSFISLTLVLPNVLAMVKPGGPVMALVKPQFEAERKHIQRGGLVKDPAIHAQVLGRIIIWVVEHGARLRGLTASPILGGDGNREFFIRVETT